MRERYCVLSKSTKQARWEKRWRNNVKYSHREKENTKINKKVYVQIQTVNKYLNKKEIKVREASVKIVLLPLICNQGMVSPCGSVTMSIRVRWVNFGYSLIFLGHANPIYLLCVWVLCFNHILINTFDVTFGSYQHLTINFYGCFFWLSTFILNTYSKHAVCVFVCESDKCSYSYL
jgi:hypothetical protein